MLRIKDPFERTITLTNKCWLSHILKEHPLMKQFYRQLRETIKNPDYIFHSKIDENVDLYFKKQFHPNYGDFFMLVVVEKKWNKPAGYVKTSFPVYNLAKGGKLTWKK